MEFALPMSGPAESQPSLDALLVAELPRLRDFVRRLVGGDDVDDVLQEVAARAWRYRGAFDGERPLAPWLRTTAVRVALDLRRRRARAVRAADEPVEALAEGERSAPSVESRDSLARVLERLTATEREVLVRFHGRGESVRDIAAALGSPEGTIKSHLHRARRKLAEQSGAEEL